MYFFSMRNRSTLGLPSVRSLHLRTSAIAKLVSLQQPFELVERLMFLRQIRVLRKSFSFLQEREKNKERKYTEIREIGINNVTS